MLPIAHMRIPLLLKSRRETSTSMSEVSDLNCTMAVPLNKELTLSSNQKPHPNQFGILVAEKSRFRESLNRKDNFLLFNLTADDGYGLIVFPTKQIFEC